MPDELKAVGITAEKVNDFSIEITKQDPQPDPVKTTYQRDFIEKQILAIQKQKDDYDAQRDAELAECAEILKAMDDVGVIAIPIEVAPEPKIPIEP